MSFLAKTFIFEGLPVRSLWGPSVAPGARRRPLWRSPCWPDPSWWRSDSCTGDISSGTGRPASCSTYQPKIIMILKKNLKIQCTLYSGVRHLIQDKGRLKWGFSNLFIVFELILSKSITKLKSDWSKNSQWRQKLKKYYIGRPNIFSIIIFLPPWS